MTATATTTVAPTTLNLAINAIHTPFLPSLALKHEPERFLFHYPPPPPPPPLFQVSTAMYAPDLNINAIRTLFLPSLALKCSPEGPFDVHFSLSTTPPPPPLFQASTAIYLPTHHPPATHTPQKTLPHVQTRAGGSFMIFQPFFTSTPPHHRFFGCRWPRTHPLATSIIRTHYPYPK
jgi:hypothetical protein